MIVRYSRRAVADLNGIASYIEKHNPSAARQVRLAIRSAIDLLAEHPRIGQERPDLGARLLRIPRYPYTAYYRLDAHGVSILHIRDDRRRPLGNERH